MPEYCDFDDDFAGRERVERQVFEARGDLSARLVDAKCLERVSSASSSCRIRLVSCHEIRLRPVRDRRGLGRRARRAHRIAGRRAGGGGRGIPHRRHLRDPRLRTQEVPGLRRGVLADASPTRRATAGPSGPPRSTGRRCATTCRRKSRGSRASTPPISPRPASPPSKSAPRSSTRTP